LKLHAAKDQEIPMGAIEDKIKAMGHTLPEPFKFPKPNRTGCVVMAPSSLYRAMGATMVRRRALRRSASWDAI